VAEKVVEVAIKIKESRRSISMTNKSYLHSLATFQMFMKKILLPAVSQE
jgi:hypothetical protein